MVTYNGARIFCDAYICKNTITARSIPDINGDQNTSGFGNTAVNFKTYGGNGAVKLVYGGGDTPETASDSALDEPIGTFNHNGSANYINGKYVVTATASNTGSDPITVKEIGIIATINNQDFLLVRQTVPARTVEPRETFTYSMAVNFEGAE